MNEEVCNLLNDCESGERKRFDSHFTTTSWGSCTLLLLNLLCQLCLPGWPTTTKPGFRKKRDGFVQAYDDCNINTVATYTEADQERLRDDERVIRNKLKIRAAIYNAQRILEMQKKSHGSFEAWLNAHHPRSKPDWIDLFKKTFKFTGGEVTGEFLTSVDTCQVLITRNVSFPSRLPN